MPEPQPCDATQVDVTDDVAEPLRSPSSSTSIPASPYVSPPRNWPKSFSTKALQTFVGHNLKGRKARLTSAPAPEHLALVEGLTLGNDSRENAVMLRTKLGWDVVGGFILYESAKKEGTYSGVTHYWNASPRGLWIDLTPRSAHPELVLVESEQTVVPDPTVEERRKCDELRAAEGLPTSAQLQRQQVRAAEKNRKLNAKEKREEMLAAQMAYKQERRRRMEALPVTPYSRLLKAIDRLPEELLRAPVLDFNTKNLQLPEIKALEAFCAEHGDLAVRQLYLQGNPIGDEGLSALTRLFPRMPLLDGLGLQATHIGSKGVEALARSPPIMRLKTLYMWNNEIDSRGLDALGASIARKNLRVDILVVHTNNCSDESRRRLRDEVVDFGTKAEV